MSRPRSPGALILMVGAPGTGKSFLARQIADAVNADIIQTDAVRKELFPDPRYSPREMGAVYAVCHRRVGEGLARGATLIFDATNLRDRSRATLYRIAERHMARILVVVAYARLDVIRERLATRHTARTPDDLSDADWRIFRRMVVGAEPMRRPHVVVNTCVAVGPVLRLLRRLLADNMR